MSTTAEHDPSREQIEIGKIFAEMINLLEDTRRKEDEREKLRAETAKMHDERERLRDEREKLRAEAAKLNAETKFHPVRFVASVAIGTTLFIAALVGLVIAVVKVLL